MKRFTLLISCLILSVCKVSAQNQEKYFPEGTTWQEQLIELRDADNEMKGDVNTYRIGKTVQNNGTNYHEVICNDRPCNKWVREENEKVYLLTERYKDEILLYDFHFQTGYETTRQYLLEEMGGSNIQLKEERFTIKEVLKQTTSCGEISYINTPKKAEWLDGKFVQIAQGIGVLMEPYKDACVLGCICEEVPLPGMMFLRLINFERNGQTLYRFEGTSAINNLEKNSQSFYHVMNKIVSVIPEVAEKGWTVYDVNGNEIYSGNGSSVLLPHAGIFLLKSDSCLVKISVQ